MGASRNFVHRRNRARMTYQEIDHHITEWADRHRLKLHTLWEDRPARFAYVSSEAGECFQISIDAPQDGRTCVYAACVEGRIEDHPLEDWRIATDKLAATLEEVFHTVTGWMRPSVRYFPPPSA